MRDKDAIMSKFREKRKAGVDLPFRVSNDLPERIAKARGDLYPFFKECLDHGLNVYFKHGFLMVDGNNYVFDKGQNIAVQVPP